MRFGAVILAAIALTACSKSDQQQIRERAHEAGDKIKRDAREVGREARQDAHKLGREIDNGLRSGREKIRKSMNEPAEPGDRKPKDDNH